MHIITTTTELELRQFSQGDCFFLLSNLHPVSGVFLFLLSFPMYQMHEFISKRIGSVYPNRTKQIIPFHTLFAAQRTRPEGVIASLGRVEGTHEDVRVPGALVEGESLPLLLQHLHLLLSLNHRTSKLNQSSQNSNYGSEI